ncbi:UTP--GlnB (protein PII) uridylyltransferase, GlnD [Desulfuromusa kysingii]|uniref:Bifunctional uridylyltransferase/uridylyl-removing enzyme n=1 Tax=Desulfuromusa kysingii TaxID=37625 RepID=A0A1H4D093_9BACT|nr:[protein-PII] uridylyltransferase [Desulfuromusa kysingii]SEA66185.1 UTP--GlnB (protein PII) uridylyltransferase, GlnD [Desulfuromusa kysingii]
MITAKEGAIQEVFPPHILDGARDYDACRESLLDAARLFLDAHLQRIHQLNDQGASGRDVVRELTFVFDQFNSSLYKAVTVDLSAEALAGCALIALGGYGRAEMNPRSDLDLMFFYEPSGQEAARIISDRMLYLLWDLRLDVGYSVRSSESCLEESHDSTVRSALLDARLISGNAKVYAAFRSTVSRQMLSREPQKYIKLKLDERIERKKKYGSSVYVLEPNLKEGEGGLRELQEALWIARVKFKSSGIKELLTKGVITEKELEEYSQALDYLWKIRNFLHFKGQRKSDQLTFDLQPQLAVAFGFKDNRRASAVEQFMQAYYAHAIKVEHLSTQLILNATQAPATPRRGVFKFLAKRNLEDGFYIIRGELRAKVDQQLLDDPALMMVAFELAQKHEVSICFELKQLIRDNAHLIHDKIRRSSRINRSFMNILRHPKGISHILRKMHHLQFLNAFIPEYKKIYCRVQFDLYHIYTVDTHTLFAIEQIEKLWAGDYANEQPLLTEVANNIEKRELLLLAILFHDIGKGSGKDHSIRGAEMIPTIARRLRLNREDSQRLQFLVLHHLKMAHISQRRDLQDFKMIAQFSQLMGMSETLRMLYLLTFADIKAVGPDVWTEWKGSLLRELYEKAYDTLEKNEFYQEKRSQKVRNRKRHIRQALLEDYTESKVNRILKSLNTRYLMSYRSEEIIPHLRLALSRGKKTLVMQVDHKRELNYTELTLATIDSPGLFSQIAGVLAAHSINILGAQIHTRKTGTVLDILQVNSAIGDVVDKPQKWARVETDLSKVISGQIFVEELFDTSQQPAYLNSTTGRSQRANKVEIDNEVSDRYTVVDIFAHDKVGLLYDITRTLNELGLYIAVSKISTKVDQAADVFYVCDIFGQKVTDPIKLAEIRSTMLAGLE